MWTAVFDNDRGLAVVSTGLLENCYPAYPRTHVGFDLTAQHQNYGGHNGEPNGLLIGTSRFRYWLMPLTEAPDRVLPYSAWATAVAGFLRLCKLRPEDMALHQESGQLAATVNSLRADGDGAVTSAFYGGRRLRVALLQPHRPNRRNHNQLPR